MINNLTLLNCLALSGSDGSHNYQPGSSFVGKSTLARSFPDRQVVSLAAEIRRALYQDCLYGDPYLVSQLPKIVESHRTKERLIELGETCNKIEPYGWVLLAVCKMLTTRNQQFIVDDVRRVEEMMLLSSLGADLIEVCRPDGLSRRYSSDGKIVGCYDYKIHNTGEAGFFDLAVPLLDAMTATYSGAYTLEAQRGSLRLISQLLSPELREQLVEGSNHFRAMFTDSPGDAEDMLIHYDGALSVVIGLLRASADNVADRLGCVVETPLK